MNCQSICKFADTCKKAGSEQCNTMCFPFVFLHGTQGESGMWKTRNVPKKYDGCSMDNLPIKDTNPKAFTVIEKYCSDPIGFVIEKGVGLFLYSIPNAENRFGTGTGKTTSAITILNQFTIEASREHLKGNLKLESNPSLFMKASELQNIYNQQFRGTLEQQNSASETFYKMKDRMKKVPLLVLDDIAIREISQAFENELYEVIDYRATNELATIFTSNLAITELGNMIGDRIASRIDGMAVKVAFQGKDFRKGGLF